MDLKEIISLLNRASVKSAIDATERYSKKASVYSKSKAYQVYGRTNVDRWIREGLIKVTNRKLDRSKLEAIAASNNRVTYLQVAER